MCCVDQQAGGSVLTAPSNNGLQRTGNLTGKSGHLDLTFEEGPMANAVPVQGQDVAPSRRNGRAAGHNGRLRAAQAGNGLNRSGNYAGQVDHPCFGQEPPIPAACR
jgi:hypothetical protein